VPAVRKSFLTAAAALLVLAGCGNSGQVDPDQAAAELGLNRGPQDFSGPAVSAEQAARRLAQDDVREAGGKWSIEVARCQRSGPVMSCGMVVRGSVKPGGKRLTCSATAAVRIRAERGTAHRTPFACGPGA
jgi:hypothetical protein